MHGSPVLVFVVFFGSGLFYAGPILLTCSLIIYSWNLYQIYIKEKDADYIDMMGWINMTAAGCLALNSLFFIGIFGDVLFLYSALILLVIASVLYRFERYLKKQASIDYYLKKSKEDGANE